VAVDDRDPAEPLARQHIEQVADDLDVGGDAQAHAARIFGEVGAHPEREGRKHGHPERLGRLDGDPLGEDGVRPQREVAVLFG